MRDRARLLSGVCALVIPVASNLLVAASATWFPNTGSNCRVVCVGSELILFGALPLTLGLVLVKRLRLWSAAIGGGITIALMTIAIWVFGNEVATSKGSVWLAALAMQVLGAVVTAAVIGAVLSRRGPVPWIVVTAELIATGWTTIGVSLIVGLFAVPLATGMNLGKWVGVLGVGSGSRWTGTRGGGNRSQFLTRTSGCAQSSVGRACAGRLTI